MLLSNFAINFNRRHYNKLAMQEFMILPVVRRCRLMLL